MKEEKAGAFLDLAGRNRSKIGEHRHWKSISPVGDFVIRT